MLNLPRGGWSGGQSDATPASKYDIRYGENLLKEESSVWPPYFVVTSPSSLESTRDALSSPPIGFKFINTLDWTQLETLSSSVPNGTKLIVAIGGGIVLDAAKYVALKTSIPLILVPTIVSTGAIIHSVFAKWKGFSTVGTVEDWPWLDAHHVVIDYSVIRKAPSHLNTAGLGDILCSQAGISEWEYSSKRNLSPPVDPSKTLSVRNQRNEIVGVFPNTLGANSNLTSKSIKFIMESIQKRDSNSIQSPYAPGSDHVFWQCVESTNNRGWVHGGGVALASVIIAWHCEEGVEQLISDLDTCQVFWRPTQLGISENHLLLALKSAPQFFNDKNNGRELKSILRDSPIIGSRFKKLWSFLNS